MEYAPLDAEKYGDLASRILYEDNHMLIFNKRVGEIVQGDKTGDEPLSETLKAFIAQRDGKPGHVFLGVPHRLDRPVSGVCIFAKTSKGLERLNAMFRTGAVHKTYWALCCSAPKKGEGLLEDLLVRNEKQNKSYIVRHGAGEVVNAGEKNADTRTPRDAKLARLKYRLAGATRRYFLLEVELLTGRHHQIRCQLAGMGCPIKGDLKYGAPRSNPNGGICLMARSISFIHPIRKEEVTVTAPVPEDWPQISFGEVPEIH